MPGKARKTRRKHPAKTTAAAKSAGWGGKRRGSGRPAANPEGNTAFLGVTIPVVLLTKLDAFADRRGLTRSQAATEAIRRLVARRK
jgi:hypothetical protein